jgi:hypothetical protein
MATTTFMHAKQGVLCSLVNLPCVEEWRPCRRLIGPGQTFISPPSANRRPLLRFLTHDYSTAPERTTNAVERAANGKPWPQLLILPLSDATLARFWPAAIGRAVAPECFTSSLERHV